VHGGGDQTRVEVVAKVKGAGHLQSIALSSLWCVYKGIHFPTTSESYKETAPILYAPWSRAIEEGRAASKSPH
jgi:hypothetical protein